MTEEQEQKRLRKVALGILIASLGIWLVPFIPIWAKTIITALGSIIAFIGFMLSLINIQ